MNEQLSQLQENCTKETEKPMHAFISLVVETLYLIQTTTQLLSSNSNYLKATALAASCLALYFDTGNKKLFTGAAMLYTLHRQLPTLPFAIAAPKNENGNDEYNGKKHNFNSNVAQFVLLNCFSAIVKFIPIIGTIYSAFQFIMQFKENRISATISEYVVNSLFEDKGKGVLSNKD